MPEAIPPEILRLELGSLLLRAADTLSFDRNNTALYGSIVQSILDAKGQSSTSYARAPNALNNN